MEPKFKLDEALYNTIDWYVKNSEFYNKKQQKKFIKELE